MRIPQKSSLLASRRRNCKRYRTVGTNGIPKTNGMAFGNGIFQTTVVRAVYNAAFVSLVSYSLTLVIEVKRDKRWWGCETWRVAWWYTEPPSPKLPTGVPPSPRSISI